MISIKNLDMAYGKHRVLEDINFEIQAGTVNTVIGANGCGKTTLFKAISNSLRPVKGSISIDGRDAGRMSNKQRARIMSVLPQNPKAPGDYSVYELVTMGRTPHVDFMQRLREHDYEVIHNAIKDVGMEALQHRKLNQLSGGEKQRAWIAMCLAQEPEILLLDEPTTYLDISYQYEIMKLIRKLNREKGITIVMILHDLNQAVRYSDNIIALSGGKVYSEGSASELLSKKLLADVFSLNGEVITDPINGCPMVIACD